MREAYQLGVMDVIQKPVLSYVILLRIQSVIELFEARKHLSTVVEHQGAALLEQAEVHGISHITGGGLYENIPRSIPDGLGAKL